MLINQHVRILEKHLNSLFPNLNIGFYVSRRSKYVMGLNCALFTLKDYSGIIAEIKDFVFDQLDEHFSFYFLQLVHTVKWKYDYIKITFSRCAAGSVLYIAIELKNFQVRYQRLYPSDFFDNI